jgi:hypothetical protein
LYPHLIFGGFKYFACIFKRLGNDKKAQLIIKEIGLIGKDIGRLVERTEDVEKKFNLVADQFRNIKVSAEKFSVELKIEEIEGINIERIEKDKE